MNPMLREARSTPYISSVPEDMNKKHLAGIFRPNCTSSVENFPVKMKELGIQFNTGSSSSTDLSNFVQFYNDAGDTEVMNKWMGLYAENKAMNCHGAASTSSSALQERRTRNHSDSDECVSQMSTLHKQLSQCSSASRNSSTPEANNVQTNCKYSVNRSMDVLSETHPNTRAPKSAAKDNFRLLEKCCSVDFPSNQGPVPPASRLLRSKEMANIFSIANIEEETSITKTG